MAEDNLPPKDFADALVEDPANPPQLQALTGYRGRSAKEGHTRLYLDPELSGWVDIPDDAILLTREVQDEYGLGKSLVWARLDAQIEQGPQAAGGGGTGADFLQGQVAQDLGAGGAAGFAARPVQPIQTVLNCPTHAPFLCLHTPPRLCPRTPQCPTHPTACCPSPLPQCPPQTVNVGVCPTLGFTCTALPPCPHNTTNPACLPHPTSNPQLCPVATPNPGCIPGIGNPGGPVEGQAVQGFAGQVANAQNHWVSQFIACQPIHTLICPIGTQNILQCLPHTSICPVASPWCPLTFPLTGPGPGTTPQLGGVGGGGNVFAQAQGVGAQAQGGMAAESVTQATQCLQPVHPTVFCPVQTAFCPAPATHQVFCPVFTHNLHQCVPQTLACPVSPWCPIGTITGPITGPGTTPQLTPQLGHAGGGGFAPAGQGVQGGMAVAGLPTQLCPPTHPPHCPHTQFQFVCPVPTTQCLSIGICPHTTVGFICQPRRNE